MQHRAVGSIMSWQGGHPFCAGMRCDGISYHSNHYGLLEEGAPSCPCAAILLLLLFPLAPHPMRWWDAGWGPFRIVAPSICGTQQRPEGKPSCRDASCGAGHRSSLGYVGTAWHGRCQHSWRAEPRALLSPPSLPPLPAVLLRVGNSSSINQGQGSAR